MRRREASPSLERRCRKAASRSLPSWSTKGTLRHRRYASGHRPLRPLLSKRSEIQVHRPPVHMPEQGKEQGRSWPKITRSKSRRSKGKAKKKKKKKTEGLRGRIRHRAGQGSMASHGNGSYNVDRWGGRRTTYMDVVCGSYGGFTGWSILGPTTTGGSGRATVCGWLWVLFYVWDAIDGRAVYAPSREAAVGMGRSWKGTYKLGSWHVQLCVQLRMDS